MDTPTGRHPDTRPDRQKTHKTPREEQFDRFLDAVRQLTEEPPIRALDATFRRLALARIADAQPLRGGPDLRNSDRRSATARRDGDGDQPTGLS